jgi:hypothetical protein
VPKVGLEPTSQVFQTSAVTILATSAKKYLYYTKIIPFLVPQRGLEPPRIAPYASETYVYTNSTTAAFQQYYLMTGDLYKKQI